jgi:hypothetical protein
MLPLFQAAEGNRSPSLLVLKKISSSHPLYDTILQNFSKLKRNNTLFYMKKPQATCTCGSFIFVFWGEKR